MSELVGRRRSSAGLLLAPRERWADGSRGATRRQSPLPLSLLAGGGLVLLILVIALLAPWIATHPPNEVHAAIRLLPPSSEHLFGTDRYGRDLFSRVIHAARLDLRIAFLAASVSLAFALPMAAAAGFYGSWLDRCLSTLVEVWLALPGLLFAIVVVAVFGPSMQNAMLAVGLMSIPSLFRTLRGCILSTRHAQYIEAARSIGSSDGRLILRHIMPNVLSTLLVLVTLRLSMNILIAGGLSFIGLGVQPPHPEWGALLAEGKAYMGRAWWLATFPGLAMTLTVMGFNLLGDGLRDLFDPRRARRDITSE